MMSKMVKLFAILITLSCILGDESNVISVDRDDDHVFAIDGFESTTKQLTHGDRMEMKLKLRSRGHVDTDSYSSKDLNTSSINLSLIDSNSRSNQNQSMVTVEDTGTNVHVNGNDSNDDTNDDSLTTTIDSSNISSSAVIGSITTTIDNVSMNTSSSSTNSSSRRYYLFDSIDDPEITTEFSRNYSVVAFYNLYAGDVFYHDIVKSQQSRIAANRLLQRLDVVYYATMGKNGAHLPLGDKYKHIIHYGNHGEEVFTLTLLYRFCGVNPTAKVLYFHDKGSLHNDHNNAKFCNLLNCFVLNPYCIDTLDDHDICGWRLSPMPVFHYSGNFWWARCDYINTLIHPLSQHINKTWIEIDAKYDDCVHSKGRYFPEGWVASGPSVKAADCMNTSVDTSYLFGYKFPSTIDKYCPSLPQVSGLPCQTAAVIMNPRAFRRTIEYMDSISPKECPINIDNKIIQRSYDWYGTYPSTFIAMKEKMMKPAINLTDGLTIRFSNERLTYVVKNMTLLPIPNADTFLSMGLEFGKERVISYLDRPQYAIGQMLPSVTH